LTEIAESLNEAEGTGDPGPTGANCARFLARRGTFGSEPDS
jgi:hypothetical protein